MRVLAELGPAECGTCCLKVMQSGTDILICDGPYQMKFSRGQAHSLMAVLQVHFKDAFEFVDLGPVAAKDREPAEDTVALLCAAAREWAKWDAREQAAIDEPDMSVFNFASKKALRYRDRTLSYGRRLLSAGVSDGQMESADLAVFRNSVVREFKRLDTLVENLRGRLAAVELSIGMEKRG